MEEKDQKLHDRSSVIFSVTRTCQLTVPQLSVPAWHLGKWKKRTKILKNPGPLILSIPTIVNSTMGPLEDRRFRPFHSPGFHLHTFLTTTAI